MYKSIENRTLAFAAVCQVANLVQQVARKGNCDDEQLKHTLNTILVTQPDDPMEVFGSAENLKLGFQSLVEQMQAQGNSKNTEITRYIVSLMALERKLSRRQDLVSMLGERISQVKRQIGHFELTDEQVLANIAGIYSDIVSPLGPRIQVAGTPAYLQQNPVQYKVRALLLAGIRCSVLWRQLGGKRRHIIFSRKKMIEQAKLNLARI